MSQPVRAQVAPGPYEILPFKDGFIIEAFFDLLVGRGNGIADWSGWTGSSWVSPNAYDGHKGTDWAVQTGTPLYALAAGTVIEVEARYARNDHNTATGHGNYVKIAIDDPSPNGESLDVFHAHMLSVAVTVGQRVEAGDLIGLSDNTGNSTSEHLHIESEIRGGQARCPFYWAHFKYPILFNPEGTSQLGTVVRVKTPNTPIRIDRLEFSAQFSTAHQGQLYFASYSKRGFYQVFVPNHANRRSGWIKATDVEEVFSGTVIQPLPDDVVFIQSGQLQSKYPLRSAPEDDAGQIGQILFGGGRFVADQVNNGYYRIPIPGASAMWGWVKPTERMVVYPELIHPDLDLRSRPNHEFPIVESFSELGPSMFGRPKFTRSVVKAFSPASPGGDGYALFVTDANNAGQGQAESVLVGKPGHRNYFVQCDVYFNYQPAYVGTNSRWERYGIFLRDDGFAGMDHSFEGGGNCYAILWDNDDGRLRAGRIMDATVADFLSPARYVTGSGWRTLRIEARENQIRYLLDGELLIEVTATVFPSGQCGVGYRWQPGSPASYPLARGAYFDNFLADTLDPVPLHFSGLRLLADGTVRLGLRSDAGSTSVVERALALPDWIFFTNVVNTNSAVEFVDDTLSSPFRFYRARRLP